MTRVLLTTFMIMAALAGCRSPAPAVDPYSPYGPQRVPPPVTGSIGAPAPQAAPYYQGSSTTTISPQAGSIGWQPPSTNLGAQPLVQTQPVNPTVTANPQVFANNPAARTNLPPTNFTSTQGQQFTTPQVTNPATIGSQPTNNAVLGTGTHSAQTQPWQPAPAPIGQPQFLPANSPPATQPVFNGQPAQPNTNTLQPIPTGQPNNGWGQPPVNNNSQTQPLPGGMHVNNATYAYSANPSPWSMDGVANWFRTTFTPTTYPTQPGYAVPQGYAGQPVYQAQQQAAVGYSTTAPTPAPLPVRGMQQQNVYPASYSNGQQPVQGAAAASGTTNPPPAMQWGSVPMASSSSPATVRGNDDTPLSALGFVTSSQASPTPHDADLFGNHADYLWLRGKLEYSTTQRQWKLRYIPLDAPEGRMDSFGGSVVLTDSEQLKDFQTGDHVMVQGKLSHGGTGSGDFAPLYKVDSVAGL